MLPRDSGVEIEGLDLDDASTALTLLAAARRLQFDEGSAAGSQFVQAMTESGLDLTPPAAVEQARRHAELRRRLLNHPVFTYETLAELREDTNDSATRTWVSRQRERKRLFTVHANNRVIIPAFQLGEDGLPRDNLAPILHVLMSAGVEEWSLWAWLVSPTPLLSGGVPVELVDIDPERVTRAAARFADRHRRPAA